MELTGVIKILLVLLTNIGKGPPPPTSYTRTEGGGEVQTSCMYNTNRIYGNQALEIPPPWFEPAIKVTYNPPAG